MHSIYCADMQFKNISLEGLVLNNLEVLRVDLLPGIALKEKKYILNIELNAVIPYLTSYANTEILSSRLS